MGGGGDVEAGDPGHQGHGGGPGDLGQTPGNPGQVLEQAGHDVTSRALKRKYTVLQSRYFNHGECFI